MNPRSSLALCALSSVLWLAAPAPVAENKSARDTQWIEDAGGSVIKDAAGRITGVNLRASWVTDTDLRGLVRLPYLRRLDLSLTRITDQGMQELKSLPGIVDLNLRYAEYVTDEGLAAIKALREHLQALRGLSPPLRSPSACASVFTLPSRQKEWRAPLTKMPMLAATVPRSEFEVTFRRPAKFRKNPPSIAWMRFLDLTRAAVR